MRVGQLAGVVGAERAGGEAAGLMGGIHQAAGGDGHKFAQIAETREGEVVPQNAVAAARHQEWHNDVRVVLPQIEVIPLDIEDANLPLAEAIERLVGIRLPLLAHMKGLFTLHFGRRQGPGRFSQDGLAAGIGK